MATCGRQRRKAAGSCSPSRLIHLYSHVICEGIISSSFLNVVSVIVTALVRRSRSHSMQGALRLRVRDSQRRNAITECSPLRIPVLPVFSTVSGCTFPVANKEGCAMPRCHGLEYALLAVAVLIASSFAQALFVACCYAQLPIPTADRPDGHVWSAGAHTEGYCPSNGGWLDYENIQSITYHVDGDSISFDVVVWISNPTGCTVGSECVVYDFSPEHINGWIDWNGDSLWNDYTEQVLDLNLTDYLTIDYHGQMPGGGRAQIPAQHVEEPMMRVNLGWTGLWGGIQDPCADRWAWGDVKDLKINLSRKYDVTKLTVSGGNKIKDHDDVIWEQAFNQDCGIDTARISENAYPFSAPRVTKPKLHAEISACPPVEDPPSVFCRWTVTPTSHEDTSYTGYSEQVTGWELDVPVDAPDRVGVYDVELKFDINGSEGIRDERTITRKLFVTYDTPIADQPISGEPRVEWYEKACDWGRAASTESVAVSFVRDGEYSYGRSAPWRYGYKFIPDTSVCPWESLVEGSTTCNYGECTGFSEVLMNLCGVLGITDFEDVRPAGTNRSGFVTVSGSPSLDREFSGNAKPAAGGGWDRYVFKYHSLLKKDDVFHDATFGKGYASSTEFISWNLKDMGSTIITTDEGATVRYLRTYAYDSWPAFSYAPPRSQVALSDPPAGLASTSAEGRLEFTGEVAFATADEDSNGLAEALVVDAGVRVLEVGQYMINGVLSCQGQFVTNGPRMDSPRFSFDFIDGAPGTYVAHLEFSGEDIFEHGANGPYVVDLWAGDSSGVYDTLECSSPAYPYEVFGEIVATLISAADSGVDLDADGKYDVLRTTLHASVRAPGTFVVSGGLSKGSVSIVGAGVNVPLQTGDQVVNLDFPGIRIRKKNIDGPYDFSACIRDTVEFNASCLEDTTGIYSASDFDISALTPTGNHDDQGLDLDGDGAYDVLRASFEVNSEVSGPVTLLGTLAEQGSQGERHGAYIATASGSAELALGVQTLSLDFRGVDISTHGTDGPYVLADVGVLDEDYHNVDHLMLCYLTDAYLASQFEEGPPVLTYLDYFTDAATDTNLNGYADSLTVSLRIQSSQDAVVLGWAGLFDSSGKFIVNGTGLANVTEGVPAMLDITFDGQYIYGNLKDGPFEIRDAYIHPSTSVWGGVKIPFVGQTAAYEYTVFERAGVIMGVVEAAPGVPAVEAEVESWESVDYTDSSGDYRLIYLGSGTTLVRARCDQTQCWNIVLNRELVGTGDSASVWYIRSQIDTLNFLVPEVEVSTTLSQVSVGSDRVTVCPGGDADSLCIDLTLLNVCGGPLVGEPPSSVYAMLASGGNVTIFSGDTLRPSSETDSLGHAKIVSHHVGGCGIDTIRVYARGQLLGQQPVVHLKSLDLNADGWVDALDSAIMSQGGACSDLNWDGTQADSLDWGIFNEHWLHTRAPSIVLSAPNGSEWWEEGDTMGVVWQFTPASLADEYNLVDILLSRDGGTTYTDTICASVPNNGSHEWFIPDGTASGRCRVKVEASDVHGCMSSGASSGDFDVARVVSGMVHTSSSWTTPISMVGDVTVVEGKTLVLEPGVKVRVATSDALHAGGDTARCELIVLGSIEADGSEVGPIDFSSLSTSPQAGDWRGIRLGDTSTNNVIDNCAIKHAYTGIEAGSAVAVDSCVISEFANDGIKAIGSRATIDNSQILLGNTGTRGIELVSCAGSRATNNTITGSASGVRYGVVVSGTGIDTVSHNRIEDVRTGIRAYGTSDVQVIGNILDGNASMGISAEESCALTVRGNSIEGFTYYGVSVKNYASVDMNAGPESGNNRIPKGAPSTNYCVLNKIAADTVEAEYNWWGSSLPLPSFFSGPVDWNPWLESDPGMPFAAPLPLTPTVPAVAYVLQNYPNPLNPVTTIEYGVPEGGDKVTLRVFDVSGRIIRVLVDEARPAGVHVVSWNGCGDDGKLVASGVYVCEAKIGNYRVAKKLVVLR